MGPGKEVERKATPADVAPNNTTEAQWHSKQLHVKFNPSWVYLLVTSSFTMATGLKEKHHNLKMSEELLVGGPQ